MTLDTAPAPPPVLITQWSRRRILGVWALAALPMALLSWVVAPAVVTPAAHDVGWFKALAGAMTAGLVWQGLLVLLLVRAEQRTLSWPVVRDALWLRRPRSPRGRVGGRVWWILLPASALFFAETLLPSPPHPAARDLGAFLSSHAGQAFFSGNWPWLGVVVVLVLFNTVLGEELLFRGVLLPRMGGAFGRWDWLANGVLFAAYHLHQPWSIPAALLDSFALAWPSRYFRSAWLGIIVHSLQSVFILVLVTVLVLR